MSIGVTVLPPNGVTLYKQTAAPYTPPSAPPSTTVPAISPIAASPLAVLGEVALSLLAPVAAGLAAFFFNPSPAGDVNESKAVQNLNTGNKTVSTSPAGKDYTNIAGLADGWNRIYFTANSPNGFGGAEDVSLRYNPNNTFAWQKGYTDAETVGFGANDLRGVQSVIRLTINGVTGGREGADGSAVYDIRWYFKNNGSLTKQYPQPIVTNSPSGYTGNNGRDPNEKKILLPSLSSVLGWGSTKPVPSNVVRASVGLGLEMSIKNLSPSTSPNSTPLKAPSQTPLQNPPNKLPLQKPTNPLEKEKTPPFDPTKPYTPGSNDLTGQIASLGAILGTIKANTSPENQQLNAKTGSCDAMKSPSCTKDFEDRIKNPLSDKFDAKSASDVVQFAAITDNFTKIKNFLNNTIVDRALGAANFAMNVHNALMLSNALGKTLATVVDTALNFTGFKFYDANTGNATTASRAFNQNVSSIIVNLIGQDQYTELTNEWKVANRIYQSSTSLLNKTERLLGAQSKVAQKGNIDVANIGNALLVNGTVNPNSYPPMAATKEANTPPDLMSDASSPLSSFAGQVRNLNTITKSVNSTLRNVSGIQKDFGKLADLTNSESKARKSIRSQSASQAKVRAKFTFLQIKQIKVSGQK